MSRDYRDLTIEHQIEVEQELRLRIVDVEQERDAARLEAAEMRQSNDLLRELVSVLLDAFRKRTTDRDWLRDQIDLWTATTPPAKRPMPRRKRPR
jgi:hypothetical protein